LGAKIECLRDSQDGRFASVLSRRRLAMEFRMHGRAERVRIVRRHKRSSVAAIQNISDSANSASDNFAAGGHCLEEGQTECFTPTREDEDVERLINRPWVGREARKKHSVAHTEFLGSLDQAGTLIAVANDY
jgi:hypothetical protein